MPTNPDSVRLHLAVAFAAPDASTLLRVLAALHRRRAALVSVRYAGAGADLIVDAPARRTHCLQAWLEAIVGVQSASVARACAAPDGLGDRCA